MKAWTIVGESNDTDYHKYDLKNFKFGEIPIPEIGDDEVLIQTKAVSINPVDFKIMSEFIGILKGKYPYVPGCDGAGIVAKIGKDVTKFEIGDRVCSHCNINNVDNTYAEYFKNKEHVIAKIPDGVSFRDASTVLCAGMTSYQAIISRMKCEKDKSIFIYSGSGGTGSFGIQFAKLLGLSPIITSSSPKNFEFCKSLGADFVIDYKTNVYEEIKKITNGEGVDYVYNTFSAESATTDYKILAYQGSIATLIGAPDLGKWPGFEKGYSVHEICLGGVYGPFGNKKNQRQLCDMAESILKWVVENKIKITIAKEFGFEKLDEAVLCLMQRKCGPGKVVVNF